MSKSIKEKYRQLFHKELSEDEAKVIIGKLQVKIIGAKLDADGKYHLLTKVEDGGFVSRGGTKYAFPGFSVSADPFSESMIQVSKVDFTQVGSDVVRVYIEAMGDQCGQLPADQTSTACKAKMADQLINVDKMQCYIEADQQVKADQFSKVNDRSNQAESLAATATGQAIRGISWLSLNNEALAKVVETTVGVVARKATEKITWCVYACSTNKDNPETGFYGNGMINKIPISIKQ